MKSVHTGKIILLLFLCSFFSVLGLQRCYQSGIQNTYQRKDAEDQEYRDLFFSDNQWKMEEYLSEDCIRLLKNVEKETSYYPVAESSVDKSLTTFFENSWMSQRTYGGERGHEGVDIMASVNEPGIYPVISMTDGTITNLGWLEKGGYRIGVTSTSGTYYYYAHMDSYANLKEGDEVKAGDLLGYMGDSGYGKEGTTGKFAVHLHIGIYLYDAGKEVSVNPYYVLKSLKGRKLKYDFKN